MIGGLWRHGHELDAGRAEPVPGVLRHHDELTGVQLPGNHFAVDEQRELSAPLGHQHQLVADGVPLPGALTSEVRHADTDCITNQLTKGAVRDGGRGVFQGKFKVPRIVGQRTSADMQHNALLLENGAEVFAKPELEIYADDVECAHGNTSGQMDENALFYMRQRGIPEAVAKAMLTEAFVAEALETAHDVAREALLETARSWLRG